jgi:serine/threonine protein kinase
MPKKVSIQNDNVIIDNDHNRNGNFSNEILVYVKLQNIKSNYVPIAKCIQIKKNMIKLQKYKNTLDNKIFNNKTYLNIILQVCKIILFLRKNNMKHNDLKPANFVYDDIEHIKIIDFESVTTIDGELFDKENKENCENDYIPNNETNEFVIFMYYLISPRLEQKLSIQQLRYLEYFFCDYACGKEVTQEDINKLSNISCILDEENRKLFNFIIYIIKNHYPIEMIMYLILQID